VVGGLHCRRTYNRQSCIPWFFDTQSNRAYSVNYWQTHPKGTSRISQDIDDVESPLAMNILDNINTSKKKSYQSFFPGASDEAIDLLKGLLKFSPLERLTADQAL
jgi:hypothetical protein